METKFELITLNVTARGEVISSNLDEFRANVKKALSLINRELTTDEEFGQAELDVKGLKHAEDVVKRAKEQALEDAKSIHVLFKALDDTSAEIRDARLEIEKQIKERKEQIRAEIIADAKERIICAERLRDFAAGAMLDSEIKGKRSLNSMRVAMDKAVALINAHITQSRKAIDLFIAKHGRDLVMDAEDLEVKSVDYVEAELRRRAEAKRADLERERLAKEAVAAKAEAEQAKQALDEANKPPVAASTVSVPPQVQHSVMESTVTIEDEWQGFRDALFGAFESLRGARSALKHQANIDRAEQFAKEVNKAWNEVNGKGVA